MTGRARRANRHRMQWRPGKVADPAADRPLEWEQRGVVVARPGDGRPGRRVARVARGNKPSTCVGVRLRRRTCYFLSGSGMVIGLPSRGCRTVASTRARTLPGFLDTRCRHPAGS